MQSTNVPDGFAYQLTKHTRIYKDRPRMLDIQVIFKFDEIQNSPIYNSVAFYTAFG